MVELSDLIKETSPALQTGIYFSMGFLEGLFDKGPKPARMFGLGFTTASIKQIARIVGQSGSKGLAVGEYAVDMGALIFGNYLGGRLAQTWRKYHSQR